MTQRISTVLLVMGIMSIFYSGSVFLFHRSKKVPLMKCYLSFVLLMMFWMIAQLQSEMIPWPSILPNIDLRVLSVTIMVLFLTIPAKIYKVVDVSQASYHKLYHKLPKGLAFVTENGILCNVNRAFSRIFAMTEVKCINLEEFVNHLSYVKEEDQQEVQAFFREKKSGSILLHLKTGHYSIDRQQLSKGGYLLSVSDVGGIERMKEELQLKNNVLHNINLSLREISDIIGELAATRTKAAVAQNLHDILGHSLTVALCTMEAISKDRNTIDVQEKLTMVLDILVESQQDLSNSIQGKTMDLRQTSLIRKIRNLAYFRVKLELTTKGRPYEIEADKTEAIFRICQEAVTNSIRHGDAKLIHIILRYYTEVMELFIIDDGRGQSDIIKGTGLKGMESRAKNLGGTISFGSDGQSGFYIHASLPTKNQKTVDDSTKQ